MRDGIVDGALSTAYRIAGRGVGEKASLSTGWSGPKMVDGRWPGGK